MRGNSHQDGARGGRVYNYRVRADTHVIAKLNSSEDLRSRADRHIIPQTRARGLGEVQVHGLGAQSYALKNDCIVANRSSADDNT